MLEIAESYTKLPTPPKRSAIFLMVTAEEKGLLGAKYYAEHPLYPAAKTLANINIDGANSGGAPRQPSAATATRYRRLGRQVAGMQGRTIKPTRSREGFYTVRPLRVRQDRRAAYTLTRHRSVGKAPDFANRSAGV